MENLTIRDMVIKRCIDSMLISFKEQGCNVPTTDVPLKIVKSPESHIISIKTRENEDIILNLSNVVNRLIAKYYKYHGDVLFAESYAVSLADRYVNG